jgi:hypothetical protein
VTIFVIFVNFRFVIRNILDWSKSLKGISSEILLRFEFESPIFFVVVHVWFRLSRALGLSFLFVCVCEDHRGLFSHVVVVPFLSLFVACLC